jgi:hypothetical protein
MDISQLTEQILGVVLRSSETRLYVAMSHKTNFSLGSGKAIKTLHEDTNY